MFTSNLIGGVVGIVLVGGFLGFLGWWLKSWPLSIIMIGVVALMIFDFVRALREINGTGA